MNKVVKDADEAIHDVADGMTLMLGGVWFMRPTRKLHCRISKKRR